jgi:hypothetical protein
MKKINGRAKKNGNINKIAIKYSDKFNFREPSFQFWVRRLAAQTD